MGFKDFFKRFFHSLNPNNYSELTDFSMKEAQTFFAFCIIIYMLFTTLLLSPAIFFFYKDLGNNIDQFQTFQINLDVETNSPITLLKNPGVGVDTSTNQSKDERVLITRDAILVKNTFFYTEIPTHINLLPNDTKTTATVIFFSVLLIPTIFFAWFLYNYVLLSLFILILSLIGIIILMSFKFKTSFNTVIKLGIYTTPILLVTKALLTGFGVYKYLLVSLLLMAIWFIIGLMLISEKNIKEDTHESHHKKPIVPKTGSKDKGDIPADLVFSGATKKQKNTYKEDDDYPVLGGKKTSEEQTPKKHIKKPQIEEEEENY